MTSIARPQRPSLSTTPPAAPLPAIPVPKRRSKALPDVPDDRPSSRTSTPVSATASAIPTPASRTPTRSVTLSAIPTATKSRSTPIVPTLSTTPPITSPSERSSSALPTPVKTLRKTPSYGVFPQPPRGTNSTPRTSQPPSPEAGTPSSTWSGSGGLQPKSSRDTLKHRSTESNPPSKESLRHRSAESTTAPSVGSRKARSSRSSGYGPKSRQSAGSTNSHSPSLLNGIGEINAISSAGAITATAAAVGISDHLLSVPSPPNSRRTSSVTPTSESQTDGGTELDETDENALDRGRRKSTDTIASRGSKRQSEGAGKENKGNVIVSVRVRPDAAGGDAAQTDGEWMVDGRRSLVSYKGREGGDYRYDNVFSPHDNNARVYDSSAKRLVRRVMEGYHGTVFAYGMTGTGKTFSMQGTAHSPGVIPLAITDIFSYIRENPSREFLLRVSYLEIYNERIYDLLSQSAPGQGSEEIKLREDSKRGVYATPLKEEIVQSPNQLMRVIARGDLARRTSSTQYNARSSRSHAVVQIVVESRARQPSHGEYFQKQTRRNDPILPGGVLVSTLSLIDLAGSEKAAENKERRTEGAHINKSLLTLGTVIARLSGEDEKKDEKKTETPDKDKSLKHLPYRDSKLTRLLQGALSGNSLISILCTIQLSSAGTSAAHASSHVGETLNTLKFASRAKNNIVSHAKRNESSQGGDAGSRALLDRYRLEIQELRSQLDAQNKAKELAEEEEEVERDRQQELELERQEKNRHEEQMLEMQLARTALKERISHLNRLILSSKSIGVNSSSGRFSSASATQGGMSIMSNADIYGRAVSVRSRDSFASETHRNSANIQDIPSRPGTSATRRTHVESGTPSMFSQYGMSRMVADEAGADDEYDAAGADGEGNASLQLQISALQADLADKNRYISTLEKRLLQARRTSRSRTSIHAHVNRNGGVGDDEGTVEAALRDKDREIDDLRAKLDDQTRMVNALRSELRKRNLVNSRTSFASALTESTARPATALGTEASRKEAVASPAPAPRPSSRASARSSGRLTGRSSHHSNPSNTSRTSRTSHTSSGLFKMPGPINALGISEEPGETTNDGEYPTSPQKARPTSNNNNRKSVDEMTLLLDQMIQDRVESGQVVRGERGSLRIKRDTVMGYKEKVGGGIVESDMKSAVAEQEVAN